VSPSRAFTASRFELEQCARNKTRLTTVFAKMTLEDSVVVGERSTAWGLKFTRQQRAGQPQWSTLRPAYNHLRNSSPRR
jgi:hypothetical protein